MKKITFFLSALLISVMSFAADYPATNTSNVSFTMGTKAYDNKIKIEGTEYQAIKLGTGSAIGDMSFTVPANTAKIHLHIAGWSGKTSAVTISASNGVTLGTTEITATSDAGMTGNSPFTLSNVSKVTSDYYHVIELTSPTTEETTITMTSISGKYRVVIWGVNTEEATSGEQGETVDAPTFSATEANFTEAFNLTITSAEGTTLKYTTDKTDPTTSATAVVVESNTATVAISAKSTMVKAVAVKGELVSNVKSMTFCYVNSEATAYTVTEALAIYNEGLGLSNKLYIKGSVKSIEDLNTEYGNATYTITDGESDLYIYRGKNFGGEKFTSADQLFVDDDLVLYGQLTSYNGNPQVAANSEIISRESKTKSILAEDLTFDAIALGDEVEAQTLTVTGANLTAEITATLDNEKFTVTPATLPAAGGDLTIAPAADLTVGEHAATLTLTSGETTNEVTLSILVKDVYAIEWYVNGEIYDETTVVEGDKLVLPAAPEAPEACSEKVFVGWTAAEEVNADGSEIEWVTAATAPTAAATYYAVFAAQEGEGGQEEVSASVTIADYASVNSWTNGVQYPSITIDKNVTATAAGESNTGKYYTSGNQWRFYQGEGATLTITAAEGITISTVAITYAIQNTGILTLDGVNIESEAICNINASSVTFGVGNTGSAANGQVRVTKINVTYSAGAAATYTDYSTTCEPEIPTVTLSCTDMDKMYMAMRDMLQLEGTSTNDEYVAVALYNYAATVGDYQAYIAFGDLELETESLTINRGSEEWTLTATIDADTAIYEFTATTAAPKTETIAPRAATWGGDAMNGYTIDCTTTIGNVQISVMDGTEYGMGWMLNMAINDALVVEGATIEAPTWEEDNLVLNVTVVSSTLDEYTIQLTATPKPATEIIANATMALSEDEYEVGTMIVSATWGEYPLSVKLNGWPYYGYGEYAEANLIIEIDPENYDFVDAYSTATLEKKEDVAVLTGTFSDWNGNKYALTLTIAEPAAAPVVETVNVVCTDMVQGEEWGTPVLTGTCNLGDINISLYLEDTDHPESVYGEYGFAEYPMGLFPAVEVTIEGEDSFIMLELMENTVAVYTDGETQDSFVGTFLGSDWKVYVLDMKTPNPEGPSALDNVTTTVAPAKAIVNGQLVIVKDGVQYNAQGAVIK